MKKILLASFITGAFITNSFAAPSWDILWEWEPLVPKKVEYTTWISKNQVSWTYKIIFPSSNPFTTEKDTIKIEWIVPDNVYSIVVDDYKLKKYKPWDTKWYYYAAKKYDSLKDWVNNYKIKYYWKDNNLLKVDDLVIYKKANQAQKVNKYKKRIDEKIFELKMNSNKCEAFSYDNYDILLKRKALYDFYRKQYNQSNSKNILEWIKPMDKYKYFYDKNSKTCVAKRFFSLEVWFDSYDECNVCLWVQKNNLVNYSNNVWVKAIVPKKPVSNIYSTYKISSVAQALIKSKKWNQKELKDLQNRAKNLITLINSWKFKLKYSTKVNFLNLLKTLDSKINNELTPENNKNDDLDKFFKNLWLDDTQIKEPVAKPIVKPVEEPKVEKASSWDSDINNLFKTLWIDE